MPINLAYYLFYSILLIATTFLNSVVPLFFGLFILSLNKGDTSTSEILWQRKHYVKMKAMSPKFITLIFLVRIIAIEKIMRSFEETLSFFIWIKKIHAATLKATADVFMILSK